MAIRYSLRGLVVTTALLPVSVYPFAHQTRHASPGSATPVTRHTPSTWNSPASRLLDRTVATLRQMPVFGQVLEPVRLKVWVAFLIGGVVGAMAKCSNVKGNIGMSQICQ